jgi:hypothetical protein
VNSFHHQLLDILKVTNHPVLEVLLSVPNINLVTHLASDLLDHHPPNPAQVSLLALPISPGVYASAFLHHKIHELHSLGELAPQLSWEHLSQIGEPMV